MEKQNKNEELSDVNKTSVEDKKPKKRSNARKMTVFLGGVIVVIMVFLIATGAWNPFKSREVSAEAKQVYEESEKAEFDIYKDVMPDDEDYDFENDTVYGRNGEHPMGLETKDFGPDGDSMGCLKSIYTGSQGYIDYFGLSFSAYYMKNKDYAHEKYIGLKGELQAQASYEKEVDTPTGKVYAYIMVGGDSFLQFAIYHNSVAYEMWGDRNDLPKMQALFDKLGIDFKVPTFEEIK